MSYNNFKQGGYLVFQDTDLEALFPTHEPYPVVSSPLFDTKIESAPFLLLQDLLDFYRSAR